MSDRSDDAIRRQREEAWIGDAVLELLTREWIMAHVGRLDAALQTAVTSNQFLSTLGNPTAVEAELGRLYQREGLDGARRWLEEKLVPALSRARHQPKPRPKRRR